MNQHHRRHDAACPAILPGYFTMIQDRFDRPSVRPRLPRPDVSEAGSPLGRRAPARRHRALFKRYLEECAAAISVLFEFADVADHGDAIVLTSALSADAFERLCALGAALEDFENDDPGEDADHGECSDPGEESDGF